MACNTRKETFLVEGSGRIRLDRKIEPWSLVLLKQI